MYAFDKWRHPAKGRLYFMSTLIAYVVNLHLSRFYPAWFKIGRLHNPLLLPACIMVPWLMAFIRKENELFMKFKVDDASREATQQQTKEIQNNNSDAKLLQNVATNKTVAEETTEEFEIINLQFHETPIAPAELDSTNSEIRQQLQQALLQPVELGEEDLFRLSSDSDSISDVEFQSDPTEEARAEKDETKD